MRLFASVTSLRGRVRWALVGFGGIAALILALGAMVLDEALEHVVIQDTLRAEAGRVMADLSAPNPAHFDTALMRHYFWPNRDRPVLRIPLVRAGRQSALAPSLRLARQPAPGLPAPAARSPARSGGAALAPRSAFNWRRAQGLFGYLWQHRGQAPPAALRHLQPGFHEAVSLDHREYYVLVRNGPRGRYYIAYDTTRLRRREHWFVGVLILAVVLILYSADRLGRHMANRLTRPLADLAETVRSVDPEQRRARIPAERGDPELSRIAQAFNGFLTRMDEYVEREQAFTRIASHELRTPLAVISGAADVIAARSDSGSADAAPLRRIRRATREMSETVEALLALARAEDDQLSRPCRVERIAEEIVAQHAYLVEDRPVKLSMEVRQPAVVHAQARMVGILISNLVRNAVQNTPSGHVKVIVGDQRLIVEDTGRGLDPALAKRFLKGDGTRMRSEVRGHGLGLYIVGQICERYGWPIHIHGTAGGGTRVKVDLQDGEPPENVV